ncbi:MAG TPA: hypothetical protein VGN72_17565 [Tepidisphaeraceae bacterium]|jgi:hypothetical protein|nr:hypothetical protein [Tepidisphaeraceae bacterium]
MEPKVGIILDRWARQECRIEYGIYFPDDTYVPFDGMKAAGKRRQVGPLVSARPDGWASLDPVLLVEVGVQVWGGETSWEGVGFLAVCEPNGSLKWLLHCEDSEPFVSAQVQDGTVVAVSNDGILRRYDWQVPLKSPWDAVISTAP